MSVTSSPLLSDRPPERFFRFLLKYLDVPCRLFTFSFLPVPTPFVLLSYCSPCPERLSAPLSTNPPLPFALPLHKVLTQAVPFNKIRLNHLGRFALRVPEMIFCTPPGPAYPSFPRVAMTDYFHMLLEGLPLLDRPVGSNPTPFRRRFFLFFISFLVTWSPPRLRISIPPFHLYRLFQHNR